MEKKNKELIFFHFVCFPWANDGEIVLFFCVFLSKVQRKWQEKYWCFIIRRSKVSSNSINIQDL